MDYIEKFEKSAFGLFVHFGLYSRISKGEWYLSLNEKQHKKDYFDLQKFKVKADWSKKLVKCAKETGCKYITLTTRHHDGFSLYDTQGLNTFDAPHSATGRDLIKEFVEECNKENVTPFFYHTLLDWHNEDYLNNFPKYVDYLIRSIEILCTSYGKIGGFWFDGMWDHDRDSVPFDWQLTQQYSLIHRLQPACLIGNNHHLTPFPGEDIQLFERDVPGENKAGLSGQEISRLPLETCQTMNGMWGYKVSDTNYKSSAQLIRLLARTAAKGANLLLNVGPQPDGSLPETALSRLKEMGEWLRANGEAIYATEGCDWAAGDTVVCTKNADALFIHLLSENVDAVTGIPLAKKPKSVTVLTSGEKLPFTFKNGTLSITNLRSLRRGDNDTSRAASCADLVLKVR